MRLIIGNDVFMQSAYTYTYTYMPYELIHVYELCVDPI